MTSPEQLLFARVRGLPIRRPTNDRGDRLERDAAWMLRIAAVTQPALDPFVRTADRSRANMLKSVRLVHGPRRKLASVLDATLAGCPVRMYDPGPKAHGTLLYFHGGGWVSGDLDTHDHLCRRLAADGEQRVIAVHYRRAPEHPFPTPVNDAVATFRALAATEGPHVAIGGDSAGGNLAAVASQVVRDEGDAIQPWFQLLIYPATDFRRVTGSHRALEVGYLLEKDDLDFYQGCYAPDVLHRRASPLLHPDLANLAPAIVVSAGFDPLRDDAEQYAEALIRHGGTVDDLRFPGLLHGFVNMDGALPSADAAMRVITEACIRRWATIPSA
ncbi:MAG: alpha/beta hydrolase [Myxococcota bacterium]